MRVEGSASSVMSWLATPQKLGLGVVEARFEAGEELVAARLVDDERWGDQEPVPEAAGVLATRVEQEPVLEPSATDDCARIDVGREARKRDRVGDELDGEEHAQPADIADER